MFREPKGADVSFINSIYSRPTKDNKYNDSIDIVYKDNTTGEKKIQTITNPEIEYYELKDEYKVDYNQLFAERHQLIPKVCKYKDIEKVLAEETGNTQFYYDNIKSGNRYSNRRLHSHTSIFRSDMDAEDYIKLKFNQEYGIKDTKITKSYIDIEVDGIDAVGDFPEMGECPINAITVIDGTSNDVYTLLLRNKDNPLIQEFEDQLEKDPNIFFTMLRNEIRTVVGGWKNEVRYGLDKLNFKLFFYDNEDELIIDSYKLINKTKPDFLLAWNMAFDVPYIIERLKVLGIDPKGVLCHPDFKNKVCNYYVDQRHNSDFAERGDKADISSYTVHIDQLIHFCSRRKGQALFKNYKLDYIGKVIAKVRKLDYSHITTEIAKLPYKNYIIFVIYNIIDTIVQKCIEQKCNDVDYIYNKSSINNIKYSKCHRNTLYLKNRGASEFEEDDLIIGNNANLFVGGERQKYKGGLVVDPKNNIPNGIKLNNIPINVFNNVVDYDFKSLYPSMMIENNIAPNTQLGRILISDRILRNENRYKDPDYDRSGAFIEDIISRCFLSFGHKWFDMASYTELCEDMFEYFDKYSKHCNYTYFDVNKQEVVPFVETKDRAIKPFDKADDLVSSMPFIPATKAPSTLYYN